MIKELNSAFSNIFYKDSTHQYFAIDSKKELLSVTKFLGKLKPEFNKKYWTVYKAYEFSGYQVKYIWNSSSYFLAADTYWESSQINTDTGEEEIIKDYQYVQINLSDNHDHLKVTPDQVAEQWRIDSLVGTTRGSYLHNYLENRENRLLDDPQIPTIQDLTTVQQIVFFNSIKSGIKICDSFLEYQAANLVPVAMEYTVADIQLGLAGRFDRLYFNKLTEEYEIWDFKTDKKISHKGRSSNKFKIFNVADCEIEKYSLQTSLYKHIIEKNTGIKLGTSRIVHIDLKNNEYKIHDCKDYTQLIIDKTDEISWSTHL